MALAESGRDGERRRPGHLDERERKEKAMRTLGFLCSLGALAIGCAGYVPQAPRRSHAVEADPCVVLGSHFPRPCPVDQSAGLRDGEIRAPKGRTEER